MILEAMELTYSYDFDNTGGLKKFPPPTVMTPGDVAGEDRHTQVNAYMGVLASRQYTMVDPLEIQQGTGTRRSTINVQFNYAASLELDPNYNYGAQVDTLYVPVRVIAQGERSAPMPDTCDYIL
jgi:hypothetical protein